MPGLSNNLPNQAIMRQNIYIKPYCSDADVGDGRWGEEPLYGEDMREAQRMESTDGLADILAWPVVGTPGISSGSSGSEVKLKTVSTTLSRVLLLSLSDLSRSVSCSSPTAGGTKLLLRSSWADGLSEGLSESNHLMTLATC